MGANGACHVVHPCGDQQHQQHGDNVTRGIEAQVDHVEMTARNKDLVHLVTDRADGAKGQEGHAPQSSGRHTLILAHRRQRGKQSYKEELNGMCDATNVGTHPQPNGRKRVGMNGGNR